MTNLPAVSEPVRLEIAPHRTSLQSLAEDLLHSGMFGRGNPQELIPAIMAKAMLGSELGLDPVQSQLLIHVVEGKPEVSGKLIGQLIKRHPRYDYRPLVRTEEVCVLQFFDNDRPCGACEERGWGGEPKIPCPSCTNEWTIHDAVRAGVASRKNWKNYPRAMLFNRCISEGYKVFCPDALRLPTYTPTELDQRSPLAVVEPQSTPVDGDPGEACGDTPAPRDSRPVHCNGIADATHTPSESGPKLEVMDA